ncbi:alpha-D-xyloside xylohydrolase [Dinghuibacter silviterrae]|uniref:Alpha-D-xyloside xylohydrolase n=2 Tax=Dinghuibacter silviterrae TaxID=1539049 RepID=A0A4R8DHM4_9BACT|nr:alpha-D-xyloside xylohydrolase [Dinghuibacter silviterrae]
MILCALACSGATAQTIKKVAPGVWSITYGTPETFTPSMFKKAPVESNQSAPEQPPVDIQDIRFKTTSRGCVLELPMDDAEKIYGFGLQVNTFQQRGLRREMHASSNIVGNVGFSHAPVPFYVSTNGYGVLINSSRYVTFYCGTMQKAVDLKDNTARELGFTTKDLYSPHNRYSDRMIVEVPSEKGVEVLLFAGPGMDGAVRRYNLYAGGGCLPPLWGLGMKYRGKGDFTDERAVNLAGYFRENNIPCTTYGLEPGWQSRAYSCSFVWNQQRFPEPAKFINKMDSLHYHLNLWEHAYTNPVSPLFKPLKGKAGDYMVWGGLVPDFADPKARAIFGAYHDTAFVQKGIAAFKLDECDAADYKDAAAQWSFPELSLFPSGIDGEKMHELFGLLYQKAILRIFQNQRTWLDVRSSGAFASPYPSVLYSDMYNNADYVRMILNAGFSGLLWSPEIRDTRSEADLIRRTQTGVLSAQLCFNSWYLSNPPWFQIDRAKNDNGEFLPDRKELENRIRSLSELRMRLVPYLYTAFSAYHFDGEPPFRALVMDYPSDDTARTVDDEYLIGPSLLAAPFLDGSSHRNVYFPAGNWYDFNTNRKYAGGRSYELDMTLDQVPLFVREGSILPLADPVPFIDAQTGFKITCRVYGGQPAAGSLYEDDGETYGYEKGKYNHVVLKWDGNAGHVTRSGNFQGSLYEVKNWEKIQ